MLIKRFFIILIYLMFVSQIGLNAQTAFSLIKNFSDSITNYPIQPKWIDFDNDNDLDLFLFRGSSTVTLENLGNDSFALNSNLIWSDFYYHDVGDFDHDGDIDILGHFDNSGFGSGVVHYKNTLPDSIGFDTVNYIFTFPLNSGWDNIYNNGKYAINTYNYNYSSSIFTLNSNNKYYQIDSISENLSNQFSFNYDIDNNGYFDFLVHNSILFNNGIDSNNKFRQINRTLIYPISNPSYFDLNNDGYLDETGSYFQSLYSSYGINTFYKNYQGDSLGYISNSQFGTISLDSLRKPNKCIFDFNNDGWLDILATNMDSSTFLYANFGNFNFIESPFFFKPEKLILSSAAADFDNDGDVDFVLHTDSIYYNWWEPNYPHHISKIEIFRNDSTSPNTPPTAPQVMWTTMDSTKIILHWRPASDVETPQATLSYNLMVGTSPKGIDITSPMADTITGFRRVVELGNAQLNNFYILDKSYFNLGDTLYWSVQTIDNGFGYSPFSKENSAFIHNYMEAPVFDTLCSNDSLFWQGNYYFSSGRHQSLSTNGDSVFVLELKVKPAYLNEQHIDLCAGQSYNWQGQNYYNAGTYTVYNTTAAGCDSIERLVLDVHPTHTHIQNASLCRGDSLALGSTWLKESGTYLDSLQSAFSCDSLVQLTLEVFPKDTVVLFSGDSLVAQSNSASIRWWDCQKQSYVFGAYGKVFIPQQNGHYAAELTEHGCMWLSQCFEVTGMGIPSPRIPNIHIRPNPSSGKLNIEANSIIQHITLSDLQGKILLEFSNVQSANSAMDISGLEKGVYLLKVELENGMEIKKLVKE